MGKTNVINILPNTYEEMENISIQMTKRLNDLKNNLKGRNIVILGHDNIDVDAVLSGLLMSRLLDFIGVKNEFCILQPVKENDTYEILSELLSIDMRKWQANKEDEERELLLLDHYETTHKGKVIGCIDHHPNQQQKAYNFMYVRDSCATAYLIYELMKDAEFPIEKKDAEMILIAMMVDTMSFRSSKTIIAEVETAKELANQFSIDYDFLEKYCMCLTPIDQMETEQIISNGQKWYNYNGQKVGSSYLQLYGMPKFEQMAKWITALNKKLQKNSAQMLVFIIFETQNNITYEYQIMKDCVKEVRWQGILSRGKDIMPLVEQRFCEDLHTEQKMEAIVKRLTDVNKTIATMESCTGGQVASEITNIDGSSNVLRESYVSYCNDAKIKFGVPAEVIEKHTVYSFETAVAMAKAVCRSSKSDIGIGVTGQLGRIDPNNPGSPNNNIWYSIVNNEKEFLCKIFIKEDLLQRSKKKQIVIREIAESLYRVLSV